MSHLSLALAIALLAGVAGGVLSDTVGPPAVPVVLASSWLCMLLSFRAARPRLLIAATMVSLAGSGWLLGAHFVDRALHPPLRTLLEQRLGGFAIDADPPGRTDTPVVVEGRLLADAVLTDSGVQLRVDVARVWVGPSPEVAAGGVSMSVAGAPQPDQVASWRAGRTIRAPAALRRPARYLNEGLPDQERAMARRGVSLVGTVKSAALVDVVARGRVWEEAAASIRARTRSAIARHVGGLSPRAAAIAVAILIGDRAALETDVERRLQEAGTYHVIAISGGNIAILAAIVLAVLAPFGIRGRAAALVVISVLTTFAAVAAGGPSVARATLMAVVYFGVRAIDHRTSPANAVGLTAAVLVSLNPLAIVDVGFWLTFGATGAILLGVSRVRLPGPALVTVLLTLLMTSIVAELALAPVGAAVFQRVTLAGLVLNFAAIPCMTLVQVASMLVVAFDVASLDLLASWSGRLVAAGAFGLVESTRLLDLAPWLTWRVPSPPIAILAAYYTALGVLAWRWRSVGRIRRIAAAVTAVLFVWIVAAPPAHVRNLGDGQLHVSLIDVGQGDAMLVTFPNGRRLMVDTGGVTLRGDFDIGDRVVGPALRARDVLSLDYLAVTHADPDHIGGAWSLTRDFGPHEIWWGIPVANHVQTKRVEEEAARHHTAWRTLQRGDRVMVGGVELRVHHPPPPDWERQRVRNDDSLVLELRIGRVSILLTGDISREVERALVPTLDLLPIVVLKVPHHGSGTSSAPEFLEHLKPAVALIGVGRGNFYGHPVPYVLDRYHRAGTEVFRTDQDGQIDLATDGMSLNVRTFTERVWRSNK
jgi:competence protein ComEC